MPAYPVTLGMNSEFAVVTNQGQKNPNEMNPQTLTVIGNSSNGGFQPRSPHYKREASYINAQKNNGHLYTNQRSHSSLSNNITSISPQFVINVNTYHNHPQQQQQQQQQQQNLPLEQDQPAAQFPNHSIHFISNDTAKLNEQTNFLHPKPPKYLSSNIRIMSASSNNSNASLKSNEQKYLKLANSNTNNNNKSNLRVDPNQDINNSNQINVGNNSEMTPQSKYFANLKRLRPSNNGSLSNSVPDELFEINNNFENNENLNIVNTTPVVIKNMPSSKINPTKYIFLKPEDKPSQHLNDNLVLNRSNTIANMKYENFNSGSFVSDMSRNTGSDFKGSIMSGDYITSLSSYNSANNNNNNSNSKNIAMSTVNQLVALKDVNYYLANSSKQSKKNQVSYSQVGNYANGKSHISYNPNMNNQVTEIKLRTNGNTSTINQMSESDFRRTHSALPLLRNGVKLQNNSNQSNNFSNGNNLSMNTLGNTGVDLKNGIKGVNTTISYKLVNSPMINSLTRAKSFLYNQNATTHGIDRRLRGGSIEKTSL